MYNTSILDILVVEDDRKISFQMERYLSQKGFHVEVERNGADAVDKIINLQPKIVVLDLNLPGLDGFGVCRRIRPHYRGDILMLTASDDDMNQVVGIELGVDDYVVKPIHPRVLLARIQLLLRKQQVLSQESETSNPEQKQLQIGQLFIHKIKRIVRFSGLDIKVTSSEFDVLLVLADHADQTISREQLLQHLRGIEYDGMDRTIDMKIASLRKKLDDDADTPYRIVTVRGKGYVLCSDSWEKQ
jgi:two-component system response regulator RstA